MFELFSVFGCCKHLCINLCMDIFSFLVGAARSAIAGLHVKYVCKKLPSYFQSGCIILSNLLNKILCHRKDKYFLLIQGNWGQRVMICFTAYKTIVTESELHNTRSLVAPSTVVSWLPGSTNHWKDQICCCHCPKPSWTQPGKQLLPFLLSL